LWLSENEEMRVLHGAILNLRIPNCVAAVAELTRVLTFTASAFTNPQRPQRHREDERKKTVCARKPVRDKVTSN